MFLDSNPLPKGEIYGFYTCPNPNCKKKCDAIINEKYCLKCYEREDGTKTSSS